MTTLPSYLSLDVEALSKFMVDPQPANSFVVINAEWLQTQLKLQARQELTITQLKTRATAKDNRIEALEQKLALLELQQPKAIHIRILDIKA